MGKGCCGCHGSAKGLVSCLDIKTYKQTCSEGSWVLLSLTPKVHHCVGDFLMSDLGEALVQHSLAGLVINGVFLLSYSLWEFCVCETPC